MSQENVEIVRRAWEFDVHGGGDRAEALETFDPDVVWCPVEEGPSFGLDAAVLDYVERWKATWEELEIGPTGSAGDRGPPTRNPALAGASRCA